ncbi:hypothetical protein F5X96DRAFT_163899 [Biscogniauxia mediterranea]|nr:hypothetical protein F5X96DRAFT_163899 [Biscogniauxia mediterranea]
MPITREPSQRALNWVRRNTSKSSLSSSVKSNSPTEIIHLGGSRVGTPTEPDPPAPDRSRPVERPITTWAFTPPPPAPPGIGTARSAPEPLNEIAQTPTELYAPGHDERPITQWYPPEWQQPASPTTDGGFGDQHQNQNQNQNYGMLAVPTGLNPAPLKMIATKPPPNAPPPTSFPSPVSSLPSAISSSSTYSSSSLSAARRRSPVTQQPYIASGLSHYNTSEETGEEPNYRPQRDTPPSPLIPKDDADSVSSLRRTQSQADMHTRSQWKALPPRPLGGRGSGNSNNSSGDEAYMNNNNNNNFSFNNSSSREDYQQQQQQQQNTRHVGQLLRSNTSPSNHTGALRVFPPLANAPPKSALPAITESRSGGSSSRPRTSERRKERSPPPRQPSPGPPPPPPPPHPSQPAPPPPPPPPVKPPRLTPRERLWLHRNYRGEATFLRAWGLHITSEEEREEGLAILRELMAAEEAEEEAQEEEQRRRQQQQYHARTTPTPAPAPGNTGLGVIAEELGSRELVGRAPPSKERLGYTAGANAQEVWRPGGGGTTMGPGPGPGGGGQRLMLPIDAFHARRVDKHARSESDSSVLGAYLDIRMSRLDD